jgi:hypothetical protein
VENTVKVIYAVTPIISDVLRWARQGFIYEAFDQYDVVMIANADIELDDSMVEDFVDNNISSFWYDEDTYVQIIEEEDVK